MPPDLILPAISRAPTSAMSHVLSTPLPSSASFHDNPPGNSQPATGPLIASERYDQGASTSSAQPLRCPKLKSSLESEPLSDEQGLLRSRPRPHRPSLAMGGHKIGAKKTRKRTSIMEGGKIVLPGASSPPPKTVVSQSDDLSSFLYGTRRPGREYVGVKYQKQQTIHRQLAVATVLTCALSSALSLSRNRANLYFMEYFRDRFSVEVTSHLVWTSLLLPMQCVALMVAWLHVRLFILRELHPLAMLCLVIVYSLPFTKWLHGVFIDFDGIVRRLPWGSVITIAGSDAIMLIIKMSGFSQWLSAQLQRYAPNQLAMQCALAVASSLLTELIRNSSTVSILLPVAVDIAVTTPCNPLYFAIPVTVAASTSLILPTSSISLAVLTNLTDTGPVQMLLLGLVVKFVALVMILLTVNLNTDFHRLPQWIFTERKNQTTTAMTTMFF
ncbi:hypothetical protein HPB50_009697 [Hyalomma asiaticum]|uniref:Uncharacterized protein n=1 Tax=Hyalomma asiaticum TaxID=266040 RepID=A0ACB7TLK1_HYAAI|nr:hypothetical protein HPB50_009697 [Hyalomma asiaticum]